MKAVIEIGGKQYFVEPGSKIYVEKLDANPGDKIEFKVLAYNGYPGTPYVANAKVEGTGIKHGKQKKILVFKYKPKKNYKRTQGHRQPYTLVEITKFEAK